jgi:hypothetical protein
MGLNFRADPKINIRFAKHHTIIQYDQNGLKIIWKLNKKIEFS